MPYIAPHIPQRVLRKRGVVRGHSFEKVKQRPEQFEIDYDHPLAKGLVFAGLGNKPGSVRYNDSSAYGNHGTLTNMDPATDWVWDSRLNRMSLDFDGSNDHIPVSSGQFVTKFGSPSFTISVWYKPYANSARNLICGDWNSSGLNQQVGINRLDTNIFDFEIRASTYYHAYSTTTTTVGSLYHLAMSWDTSTLKAWVNGVREGGDVSTSGTIYAGNGAATIGRAGQYAGLYLNGALADFLIHSRPLRDSEVQLIADPSNVMLSGLIKPLQGTTKYFRGVTLSDAYTLKPPAVHVSHGNARPQNFTLDYSHPLAKGLIFAGLGNAPGSLRYNDSSALKNHGTLTNMDPATDWSIHPALNRPVLDFDGSNDYVSTGIVVPPDFTVACWYDDFQYHGGDVVYTPFGCYSYATSNRPLSLRAVAATYVLVNLRFSDYSDVSWDYSSVGAAAKWWGSHHVALTKSGEDYNLFLDGVSQGVKTSAKTILSTAIFNIGIANTSYPWLGRLGDTCIWNRAINESEAERLADPANVLLSGLIQPILAPPLPLAINDRHWVGRSNDWHAAENWSRSQGGRGGAGVPNENTNVFLD